MGRMKDLLITIYNGGDEAVAAVERIGKDWREQLEQAASEIERRWIPVEERLPEEGATVLGFLGCHVTGWKSYGQAWNKGGEMTWNEGGQPSHWMPLPEPPEAK
jgi:hypothetical protein